MVAAARSEAIRCPSCWPETLPWRAIAGPVPPAGRPDKQASQAGEASHLIEPVLNLAGAA